MCSAKDRDGLSRRAEFETIDLFNMRLVNEVWEDFCPDSVRQPSSRRKNCRFGAMGARWEHNLGGCRIVSATATVT
jgi:hypothetical protein